MHTHKQSITPSHRYAFTDFQAPGYMVCTGTLCVPYSIYVNTHVCLCVCLKSILILAHEIKMISGV